MLDGGSLDWSHCWHITIGDDVTMAPGVRIIAHDASTKMHLGYTRIGKVEIGDRVFIGAASIVLPGVRIGTNVVIGAGSVVSKSIPDNTVACGNPARAVGATDEWLVRKRREMGTVPCFGEEYTSRQDVTEAMKVEMNSRMTSGIGYVV
ncbi:MAG: acetyltransferase [Actinobacteria bacterium HGW-Actinobacteria-6]|nr:MAG: acetyltransferase [Actinobacteria bacterium HGW-Actinobacteria-6]